MKKIQKLFLTVLLILSQSVGLYAQANMPENKAYRVIEDFEDSQRVWEAKGARYQHVEVKHSDEKARFGKQSLKMSYDFQKTEGVSGVYAEPSQPIEISGEPKKMGLWVYGDQAGHWLRLQMEDANGQTFNLDLTGEKPGVNWRGWRYVEATIPDTWKAPYKINEQGIRYMATLDDQKNAGHIYVDQLIAVYEEHDEDFTIPKLNKVYPEENEVINHKNFEIKLDVEDEHSGIDSERTKLFLDGKSVDFVYDNGVISYLVEERLSDGLHELDLELFDKAGNHLLERWRFFLDTDDVQIHFKQIQDHYLSGSQNNQIAVKVNNVENIETIRFEIEHSEHLENVRFEVSEDHAYQQKESMHIIDINGSNQVLGHLVFDIPKEAHGQFKMKLSPLQYQDGENSQTYQMTPLVESFIQPYQLSVEGLSQGNRSIFRIVDLEGKGVEGAQVELVKGPELLKLKKDSFIWKGKSGLVEEKFRSVSKGDLFAIAKEPSENFPYYRIYLEDGNQRYFYLHVDDVEKVAWDSLWDLSNQQGEIHTEFLTLTQVPLILQASKGDLVSQLLEVHLVGSLTEKAVENVLFSYGEDASSMMNVSWKGKPESRSHQIFVKEQDGDKVEEVTVTGQLIADKTGEFRQFKHSFTNLKANTTYLVYMQDGTEKSEEYTFTTTAFEKNDLSFGFVADSQAYDDEGFALYRDMIETVKAKHGDLSFLVHGGDLVEEGNRLNQWDLFLKYHSQTNLPLLSTLGNHDVYGNGYDTYNALIENPKNGPKGQENAVYFVDMYPVRMIVLNTETSRERMQEQITWMEEVLEDNPMPWSFVVFHRSPYKANPKRQNDRSLEMFAPALERLKVDFVLTGHDHSYMRRKPIHQDEGPIYIIGGSSGPKFYPGEVSDYTDVSYGEEKQVMTYFNVTDTKVSLLAYNSDGILIDDFSFEKEKALEDPIVTPSPQNPDNEKETTIVEKPTEGLDENESGKENSALPQTGVSSMTLYVSFAFISIGTLLMRKR